jgi:hypothetical protein
MKATYEASIVRNGGTTILTGFDSANAALDAALRFLRSPGVYGHAKIYIDTVTV